MPPDRIVTRLDGWLAPEVNPDRPPPVVEAMLLIPRRDDADVITAIRERMVARHRAAGLDVDDV